jgi:hypothetical protein
MISDKINKNAHDITSFLMIGQSNMAGRGDFADVEIIDNDMCFMLRMGRWQKMSEPINPDREIFEGNFHSGISLSASFADSYTEHFGKKVGLIPCADGGTSISQWLPGEILFDHAVMMAKLAMRSSNFGGILWHQGESDCSKEDDAKNYYNRFKNTIDTLKGELGLPADIPVIIGELGSFIAEFKDGKCKYFNDINRTLKTLSEEYGTFVSAEGLVCKDDGLHFTSASYREFGKRHFEAYLRTVK